MKKDLSFASILIIGILGCSLIIAGFIWDLHETSLGYESGTATYGYVMLTFAYFQYRFEKVRVEIEEMKK